MPGPYNGCSIRDPLFRKCCRPISTNTPFILCEKCKRRPCCQMSYVPVCNCCLAKHKLKLCCGFERTACVHRTHSEVILNNHAVEGTENEKKTDNSFYETENSFDKPERIEREVQTGAISIDNTDVEVQTASEENIRSNVNEFNWNDKGLYRNSKFNDNDDDDYKVIKPPPKEWNISQGKSTVPKICFKTEWFLENTKEFSPNNTCECELCMKERDSSMNAFKNCFSCCKKKEIVYTRYRKVPVPDFSESEDEKIGEKLKKSVGAGKHHKRKRNRR